MSVEYSSYGFSDDASRYLDALDQSLEKESTGKESCDEKCSALQESMIFLEAYKEHRSQGISATLSSCKGQCSSCKVASSIKTSDLPSYEEVQKNIGAIQQEVHLEKQAMKECLDILGKEDLPNDEKLTQFYEKASSSGVERGYIMAHMDDATFAKFARCLSGELQSGNTSDAIKELHKVYKSDEARFKSIELREAVKEGNTDLVKELIKFKGIDTEGIDFSALGDAVLYQALESGNVSVIEKMCQSSSIDDIDPQMLEGVISSDDDDVVAGLKELIKHTDILVDEGNGSLGASILEIGSAKAVKVLLESDQFTPDLFNSSELSHISPWLLISTNQSEGLMQVLLESDKVTKELLSTENADGFTPTMLLSSSRSQSAIQALVSSEKVPKEALTEESPSGHSAVMIIAKLGASGALKALLESDKINQEVLTTEDPEGWTPLMRIADSGSEEVLKTLLESGKVNLQALMTEDPEGRTPLMHITERGSQDAIKALLAMDFITSDILTTEDTEGWTPITRIASNANEGAIKALLQSDKWDTKSFNTRDPDGRTLWLTLTCFASKSEKVMLLNSEKVSADVLNTQDADGLTPLMYLAGSSKEDVRMEILQSGKVTEDSFKLKGPKGYTLATFMTLFGSDNELKTLITSDKVSADVLQSVDEEGLSPIMRMARSEPKNACVALLQSDKITEEVLCMEEPQGWSPMMYLSESQSESVIQALLESKSVTHKMLNTEDARGESPAMHMASYGSEETVRLLVKASPDKVSLPEILSKADSLGDPTIALKIKYASENPSSEEIEADLRMLTQSNNRADFKTMLAFSKKIKLVAARNFGNELLQALDFNPIQTVIVKESDTMPNPKKDIDIASIRSIGGIVFRAGSPRSISLSQIQVMLDNVKNRTPLAGLPNVLKEPEKFEKAYVQIEKSLKVITTVIEELHDNLKASSDEAVKKDLTEKLESIYSRLSEISKFCGTRYSQDLPMLYHGELTLLEDLNCIKGWKEEEVEIPSHSDPKEAIKSHLSPLLYKVKIDQLRQVYNLTAKTGNVHESSSFWKAVKEPFHLDDGVDTDPLANPYRISIEKLQDLFYNSLDNKEVIEKMKKAISADGADNPYNSLISHLATQTQEDPSEILMEAFQMDEETYEFKDMTDGFIALCLSEVGLATL